MVMEKVQPIQNRSTHDLQQKFFFLFDTMCGRSSLRSRFDGTPTEPELMMGEKEFNDGGTENNIDFLFGFAGYDYRKITDEKSFSDEIRASIDAGNPVLVQVKEGTGLARVIIGYDCEKLIDADYEGAKNKPTNHTTYEEIKALYVFGDKIPSRYSVVDALKRIRGIMEYNQREKVWDSYIEKLGLYAADGTMGKSASEKSERMHRVAKEMWHTFNSHNFAEVFRVYCVGQGEIYDGVSDMSRLKKPELTESYAKIGGPLYGYTHDLAWALIGLDECADWNRHAAGYFGEMVELTLLRINKNDECVLKCINEIIDTLEKE